MGIASDNQEFISDLQGYLNDRYQAKLQEDGHAGRLTRAAAGRFLPGFGDQIKAAPLALGADQAGVIILPGRTNNAAIDTRSAGQIETILPQVQPLAVELILKARAAGIEIKIISGTRTYAEQNALYARATNGKDDDQDGRIDEADERVTKARGGYSNHNFGIAFDIGIFEGERYLPESKLYAQVVRIAKSLGLECGADWKSFPDEPHFQLRPPWARAISEAAMLAEFRARVAAGKSLF
ncbi:MAG: M15 family metallopeptidase [Prosthecobacter sp.]|nr:M15 family metallopeptidase [Prosthecobacter sp.]